jgi:ubiquinone/menaquinone biosynthesis C-methylase UbiE
MKEEQVELGDVRSFWDTNPVCAASIPHPIGSPEYFVEFDRLREDNEPPAFFERVHECSQMRGKKVLDVGCGNGFVLSRYARAGAEVFGVDITPTGIELCQRRFEIMGLRGDFRVANAEELPFPDATFDCVSSVGVLHHIPHPERGFAEIQRVLKPGGLFVLMLYHRDSAWYQVKMRAIETFKGKTRAQQVNEVDGAGNPKGLVYSKSDVREILSGYRDIEMFTNELRGWMVFPFFGKSVPRALLRPFERHFGWHLFAKARKA